MKKYARHFSFFLILASALISLFLLLLGKQHISFFRANIGLLVIVLAVCFVGVNARMMRGNYSAWLVQFLLFLIFLNVIFLFFGVFSLRYYDNPAFDLGAAYLRQVIPLFLFFFFASIVSLVTYRYHFSIGVKQFFQDGTPVWQYGLIFFSCCALLLAYLPLRKNYYPSFDSSIFTYIGQQILRGKMPYLDGGWDHKPALTFYIDALGLWLAGTRLIGIWLIEFLMLLFGNVVFYSVLKKQLSAFTAVFIVCLGILHQARFFDSGNYTEEYAMFFAFLSIGIYFSDWFSRKKTFQWILLGLFSGLAFSCKQNMIGFWLALLIWEGWRWIHGKQSISLLLKKYRLFLFGFLSVTLFWVLWFASHHALREYWDTAFRYNFLYTQKSGESRWATGWTTFSFLPAFSFYFLFGLVGYFALLSKTLSQKRDVQSELFPITLFWLPIELFFASLSGMNYQHYFILCVPAFCVCAAWFYSVLAHKLLSQYKSHFAICMISLLLCGLSAVALVPVYQQNYEPRNRSAAVAAADFLQTETLVDDPVQIWGGVLSPYVLAGRSSSSRFFNTRPLYLFSELSKAEEWLIFTKDLMNSPPQIIIYMNHYPLSFVPLELNGFCLADNVPPQQVDLYDYLCKNYSLREIIQDGESGQWGIFSFVGSVERNLND